MATRAIDKDYLKTTSAPEPLVHNPNIFTDNSHNILCQNCLYGATAPNKMATRALDKIFLKRISPPTGPNSK